MPTTGARRRPQKYPDELRERAVRMVLKIRERGWDLTVTVDAVDVHVSLEASSGLRRRWSLG